MSGGDLVGITVATMRLRNLVVSALALLLVVGCSSDAAPAADRVREVVSGAGAAQIGWVDVSPTVVRMYYLDGDQPKAATKASGDVTTSTDPSAARFLTQPTGPDQLRLDEFTAHLDAVQGCADGTYGSINVTHTGAVLQQVGCSEGQGGTLKQAYLDGQLLAPIDGWTEATLAAQLQEFASLIGDQGQQLNFYTPPVDHQGCRLPGHRHVGRREGHRRAAVLRPGPARRDDAGRRQRMGHLPGL